MAKKNIIYQNLKMHLENIYELLFFFTFFHNLSLFLRFRWVYFINQSTGRKVRFWTRNTKISDLQWTGPEVYFEDRP